MRHGCGFGLQVLLVCLLGQRVDAVPLWGQDGHEAGTHGSIRLSGTTLNRDAATCFTAPGAGARYRLGNECDNLIELGGYYRYQPAPGSGYLHAEHEVEAKWAVNAAMRYSGILQSYLEAGNIAGSGASFWIGQRKNRRRKIYINDYYYMNLKGKGLGVRDIPVGTARLAYAYLRSSLVPAVNGLAAGDLVSQSSHDLSFSGFSGQAAGTLLVDFRHSRIEGAAFAGSRGPVVIHGAQGWAFSVQYGQEMFGGTNKAVVQYGKGAARAAWSKPEEAASVLGKLAAADKAGGLEAAETWRLLDYQLFETSRWAFMGDVIAEKQDSRQFDAHEQTWLSLGGRYTRFIGAHTQVSAEAGYDRVSAAGGSGSLFKETLAMEWVERPGFFTKPILRAYVIRAGWSGAFAGKIGGAVYAHDTRAWSGGIQVEHKW